MMVHKLMRFVCVLVLAFGGFAVAASAQVHGEQKEATKDVRSRLFKQALADSGERECIEKEEGGVRAAEEKMSVEQVDLNRDGVSEYEVELSGSCACGMVNCSIYLYRQTPGGFELITQGPHAGSSTFCRESFGPRHIRQRMASPQAQAASVRRMQA